MKISFQKVVLLIILAGALFVRTYRIADFTTFRGDQGNAGVVLFDAVKNRQIPLVGPTVSTGELPGPAYYYIIAIPFILSHYNPLVPAVMFALLGVLTVYLLYWVASRMFGVGPALVVTAIRAFSQIVVESDRNMWNPTAIPFFVTVVIFSMYKIHAEKKPVFLLLAAFATGILVQLHYTNALWIPVLGIFWLYESYRYGKGVYTRFLKWAAGAVFAFCLPLVTFLYYEAVHGFTDLKEVAFQLFRSPSGSVSTRFLLRIQNVIAEVFARSFPFFTKLELMLFVVILLAVPFLIRKNVWSRIFALIVAFYILILSLYKGPLFDHYLKFFSLTVLLLTAGFLETVLPKKRSHAVSIVLVILVAIFYVPRIQLTRPQIGEYAQTNINTTYILSDGQKNEPFAFGLISSPSYSDYHYRFFFHLSGHDPVPVISMSYKKLYLVCDDTKCPPYPYLGIESMRRVRVFCFDLVCKGDYPVIDLTKFGLTKTAKLAGSTIYLYERY